MKKLSLLGSLLVAVTTTAVAAEFGAAGLSACPASLAVADCDTGVVAQRADGTCLQDLVAACSPATSQADLLGCLADLQPLLSDDEFASVSACGASALVREPTEAAKECKGRLRGTFEDRTFVVEVCAKNEGKALAAAKDAIEKAAEAAAEATCAPALACDTKECAPDKKVPRRCALDAKVKSGKLKGAIVCTPTTRPCNPPVQGSLLWSCTGTADFDFDCSCGCVKQ